MAEDAMGKSDRMLKKILEKEKPDAENIRP